jgi:hypothetical protein
MLMAPVREQQYETPAALRAVVDASEERPKKSQCVAEELLLDGSMVLYHSCRQQIMTLNPTATLVWECCDGAHSLAMIAQELRDVFPDAPTIEDDIMSVLRDFVDRGIVTDDNV